MSMSNQNAIPPHRRISRHESVLEKRTLEVQGVKATELEVQSDLNSSLWLHAVHALVYFPSCQRMAAGPSQKLEWRHRE